MADVAVDRDSARRSLAPERTNRGQLPLEPDAGLAAWAGEVAEEVAAEEGAVAVEQLLAAVGGTAADAGGMRSLRELVNCGFSW